MWIAFTMGLIATTGRNEEVVVAAINYHLWAQMSVSVSVSDFYYKTYNVKKP